jgi:NAD-dependent deacetylase
MAYAYLILNHSHTYQQECLKPMENGVLKPNDRQALDDLARVVRAKRPLVAFTGAGVSTESGIPDYRGPKGLWTNGSATPVMYQDFMTDEGARIKWWRSLPERIERASQHRPNTGHHALVRLERADILAVTITQNIDGLHQDAGADEERVVELHGNTRRIRCTNCRRVFPSGTFLEMHDRLVSPPGCPVCQGILKSASVAFGEPMPEDTLNLAVALAQETGVMLVVGSTLTVNPAARIPEIAKRQGAYLVILNQGETALDHEADLRLEAPSGRALTYLADQLLSDGRT